MSERFRIILEVDVMLIARSDIDECALKLGIAVQTLGTLVYVATEKVDKRAATLKGHRE